MIQINCTTKEEADQVIGAFDILLYSVPEEAIPVPYEEISINVNGEPYEEWGSFVGGLKAIDSLMKGNDING